jgi:hypothetical protein
LLRGNVVAGFHAHASVARLDANLASVEDAVKPAVVPQVGEIGTERPVALRRERKVERLRK